MHNFGMTIAGTGSYLPERVLTNADLEKMVDTSDDWIFTRTGIRERRIAAPDEPTSQLAFRAAERALDQAGMRADELDLIIVATLSPDRPFPNTACYVQERLGAYGTACFSLEAACSGFIYGLEVVASLLRSGAHRNVLLVAAEKITMWVDWEDRATCVLFGDGAGAMVLRRCDLESDTFRGSMVGADGRYADLLSVPAGGSVQPFTPQTYEDRQSFIRMNGREVFKLAVKTMAEAAETVLDRAGVTIDDIRWLVPHQANTRIIQAVSKRLGVPDDRVYMNLDRYGNTSAATIPICLDEIHRQGQVCSGDHVLLVAFGGGLTWGAALVRWP